jgi:hypothetical protein
LNRGYPKTIVLFFHEFVIFWGSGTLHGKIVSDGDAVQVKEQVLYLVLWEILDPQNRPFSPFSPYSSPSERRSASQKGIIRPVFLPAK